MLHKLMVKSSTTLPNLSGDDAVQFLAKNTPFVV